MDEDVEAAVLLVVDADDEEDDDGVEAPLLACGAPLPDPEPLVADEDEADG